MPRTRSQKNKDKGGVDDAKAELVYYKTLQGKERSDNIAVISKGKLKNDPNQQKVLKEKFDKIAKSRAANGDAKVDDQASEASKKRIIWITHINVFLYASCFFIQVGTLPVRKLLFCMKASVN